MNNPHWRYCSINQAFVLYKKDGYIGEIPLWKISAMLRFKKPLLTYNE